MPRNKDNPPEWAPEVKNRLQDRLNQVIRHIRSQATPEDFKADLSEAWEAIDLSENQTSMIEALSRKGGLANEIRKYQGAFKIKLPPFDPKTGKTIGKWPTDKLAAFTAMAEEADTWNHDDSSRDMEYAQFSGVLMPTILGDHGETESYALPAFVLTSRDAALMARILLDRMHVRPASLKDALAIVEREASSLVDMTLWLMHRLTSGKTHGKGYLISTRPKGLLHSVLLRAADTFPWASNCDSGRLLHLLLVMMDEKSHPESEIPLGVFPPDIPPLDVAQWTEGHMVMGIVHHHTSLVKKTGYYPLTVGYPPAGPAHPGQLKQSGFLMASLPVLYRAKQAVEQDKTEPRIAIDAGRAHHDLMTAWRDLPKRKELTLDVQQDFAIGRVELLLPGGQASQLSLPMDGAGGLHDATIRALRDLCKVEGLRHWATLLKLFSVEGHRAGQVQWTIDAHLEAMGYSENHRRDAKRRAKVAQQVELLTRLQIAVYDKDHRIRERSPILQATRVREVITNSGKWQMEGMKLQINPEVLGGQKAVGLQINPLLYSGVRNSKTGEIGKNFFPTTADLPTIDHVRYPDAYLLGLVLPIRWKWKLSAGHDHLPISGAKLLEMAGIPYTRRRASQAWERLERSLKILQTKKALGRHVWKGEPWTLRGICRLFPPDWATDPFRGVGLIETIPEQYTYTGGDLLAWRESRKLTQAEAAKVLGVHRRTIIRAEMKPDKLMNKTLMKALNRHRG